MSGDTQKGRGGLFGRLFGGEKRTPDEPGEAKSCAVDDASQAAGTQGAADVGGGDLADNSEVTANGDEEVLNGAEDQLAAGGADRVDVGEDTAGVNEAVEPEPGQKVGWFQKLRSGLSKTSAKLSDGITGLFTRKRLDPQTLEDFEDLLIQSDLGVETAMRISDVLSKRKVDKGLSPEEVRAVLAAEVERVLAPVAVPLKIDDGNLPHIILVVGVNGTGKTTTIGKIAAKLKAEGKSVMLAAGDTFRAAAIDQLKIWGERTKCPVIARGVGSDAAGLVYDAVKSAQQSGCKVLIVDTAGRLQNKQGLMDELEKVVRVIEKLAPGAPHDVLLVLDATTGQNAMQQVEVFRERAGVTGIVLTKLDGTARGGILVAISAKHGLPVHAIGVGEGVDDLQPFDAGEFARAISAN